jgi:hypothetical protein
MAFDDQSVYNKHQVDCDCENNDCSCKSEECGCCPPGLVAYQDCNGNISCLTPNDAAEIETESHIPVEGYIKLYHPTTGEYLGDVTPTEALNFISAIDDNVDAPTEGNEYNVITQDSIALSTPAEGELDSANVPFSVDRLTCDENIAVTLSTPPAGVTFLGGATALNIPSGTSEIIDGIQITDAVAPGNYNVTVVYDGCGNAKAKTLILNVT